MIKHNQDGAANGLVLSLVFTAILLVGAISFGTWAFASRQDYKANTDQKISAAVIVAKQDEGTTKDAQFAQDSKKPLRLYQGPEAVGSINLLYPKTWSGYVDDSQKSGNNGAQLDGYFYPNTVPSITDTASVFALRIQVNSTAYSQVVGDLSKNSSNTDGPPPDIRAYSLPKVPKAIGVKVTGTLPNGKQGTMVVLPLRSQTLQIWEESDQFKADFENNILPNFSFIP